MASLVKQYLPKIPHPPIPKPDKIRDLKILLGKPLKDTVKFYVDSSSEDADKLGAALTANPFNIMGPPSVAIVFNTLIPKTDESVLCLLGNKIVP